MPSFTKMCSIDQGFNYRRDRKTTVGFITTLTISDNVLTPDINIVPPILSSTATDATELVAATTQPVVAVMSDMSWGCGPTDPIFVSGQVSYANRQAIAMLLLKNLDQYDVSFTFVVYEYDARDGVYFPCFRAGGSDTSWSTPQLTGVLQRTSNDELSLYVSDERFTGINNPQTYGMNLGIAPSTSAQQVLNLATSMTQKVVKEWSIQVGTGTK